MKKNDNEKENIVKQL